MFKTKIKIHRSKNLTSKSKENLITLIREENSDSILAKLPNKIIIGYLDIVLNSNFINLFLAKYKSKIIGYAILAQKPCYLVSEFYKIKYKILFNLLFNIQFFTILNIIISVLKVDIILLNNNYKKLIKKNYNLNLLAIKKKFQSKGIGKFFLKELIKRIKTQKHTSYITCETFNDKALDFYIKKCNFKRVGTKFRFFKNLHVLCKKIN